MRLGLRWRGGLRVDGLFFLVIVVVVVGEIVVVVVVVVGGIVVVDVVEVVVVGIVVVVDVVVVVVVGGIDVVDVVEDCGGFGFTVYINPEFKASCSFLQVKTVLAFPSESYKVYGLKSSSLHSGSVVVVVVVVDIEVVLMERVVLVETLTGTSMFFVSISSSLPSLSVRYSPIDKFSS